jgi:hypothetical protein
LSALALLLLALYVPVAAACLIGAWKLYRRRRAICRLANRKPPPKDQP